MADEWFYRQRNERHGPVSAERLRSLATAGWLAPGDLVWQEGMPEWVPAGNVRGLFPHPLVRALTGGPVGVAPPPPAPAPAEPAPRPADRPARRLPAVGAACDWEALRPRHLLAAAGAFIAALGVAFTVIAHSRVALAFTLGGLALAALGMYVEVGRLLHQALDNIAKASREAAARRQEARRLEVERQRLALEAQRLEHQQAVLEREAAVANRTPPVVAAPPPLPTGNVVVINEPPVQRWSPGLAAVLSFFVPGLGQLYKGQILNAIVWFFCVGLGYLALILPGLVLHLFCIIGAASGNPWTAGKTTVVRQ